MFYFSIWTDREKDNKGHKANFLFCSKTWFNAGNVEITDSLRSEVVRIIYSLKWLEQITEILTNIASFLRSLIRYFGKTKENLKLLNIIIVKLVELSFSKPNLGLFAHTSFLSVSVPSTVINESFPAHLPDLVIRIHKTTKGTDHLDAVSNE